MTETELKRNIEYVVNLVKENPGKLDLFELTKQTRLKHDLENPLGLKDAREAIEQAESSGLIKTGSCLSTSYTERVKYANKQLYYPAQTRV